MSVPTPSRTKPKLRGYVLAPWTDAARRSPALADYCADHGYLTPNFAVAEMADTQTRRLPAELRENARRHCMDLELLRHWLAEHAGKPVAVSIDGPYRTPEHNRQVHGAVHSQHLLALASDHFRPQVDRWIQALRAGARHPLTYGQAFAMLKVECDRIFGGVGTEGSGTFHLDSRAGAHVDFTDWVGQ